VIIGGVLNAIRHKGVNSIAPLAVVAAGLLVAIAGRWAIGFGMVAGAILAYLNTMALVKRIRMVIMTGSVGLGMLFMQVSLLAIFIAVAIVTVLMIQISSLMTLAMAISFLATQTLILVLYYRAHREAVALKRRIQ
jgi:hypothetical protein